MPTIDRYFRAAGRRGLRVLYDPIVALTMRQRAWRPVLVEHAAADRPQCSLTWVRSGTLTIELARALPSAEVSASMATRPSSTRPTRGGRSRRVHRAERGIRSATAAIRDSADVAVLSLLLHHPMTEDKRLALREARRALPAGGEVLIADWGRPRNPLTAAAFLALRVLDGWRQTADHAAASLADIIKRRDFAPSSCSADRRPLGATQADTRI